MLLQQLGITGPGLFRQRGGFLWQIDSFGILPEGFDFGRLYGFRSGLLRSLFAGQHFPIRQLLLQFSGEFLQLPLNGALAPCRLWAEGAPDTPPSPIAGLHLVNAVSVFVKFLLETRHKNTPPYGYTLTSLPGGGTIQLS